MSKPYLISIRADLDPSGVKRGAQQAGQSLAKLGHQADQTEQKARVRFNKSAGMTDRLSRSSSRLHNQTLIVTSAFQRRTNATHALTAATGMLSGRQQAFAYQIINLGQVLQTQQSSQGSYMMSVLKLGLVAAVAGAAFAGFSHEINKTTDLSVRMGDTLFASSQVIGDALYDAYIAPFETGFTSFYDFLIWTTKTLVNSVVVTVMSAGLAVEYGLLSIWTAIKSVGGNIKNFFIDALVSTTNFITGGFNAMLTGINTMMSALGGDKVAKMFGMSGQIKLIPEIDLSGARAKTGQFKSEIADLNKVYGNAFDKLFTEDHAGKFFDLVQKQVVKNLTKVDKKAAAAAKRLRDAYDKIIMRARQRIDSLNLEARTIGMTVEATNRLRYAQDLMNQVERAGIELTPKRRAQLQGLAKEMAAVEAQVTQLRDTYEFGRESTRGFFADLKSGIEEGKTLWASLGDAISNVFDRIANKALEAAADGVWDMLFGAFFGGGSGLFDAGPSMNPINLLASANGNVVAGPGINAYSNSIVTKPTIFPFAKGIGLMGEAGKEAILPLQRGSDGRLGVSGMVAANSNQTMVLNVYNNSGATVRQSEEPDGRGGRRPALVIEDTVAAAISRTGSSAQRALGQAGGITNR